jgi:hypothetical protein
MSAYVIAEHIMAPMRLQTATACSDGCGAHMTRYGLADRSRTDEDGDACHCSFVSFLSTCLAQN